jgi:hypothetical protein
MQRITGFDNHVGGLSLAARGAGGRDKTKQILCPDGGRHEVPRNRPALEQQCGSGQ